MAVYRQNSTSENDGEIKNARCLIIFPLHEFLTYSTFKISYFSNINTDFYVKYTFFMLFVCDLNDRITSNLCGMDKKL